MNPDFFAKQRHGATHAPFFWPFMSPSSFQDDDDDDDDNVYEIASGRKKNKGRRDKSSKAIADGTSAWLPWMAGMANDDVDDNDEVADRVLPSNDRRRRKLKRQLAKEKRSC